MATTDESNAANITGASRTCLARGCMASTGETPNERCRQSGCMAQDFVQSDKLLQNAVHGEPVAVLPSSPDKQYRKALASAMVSTGMAFTALHAALPYLQHAAWFPAWIAPLVAAAGAGWTAWKQANDAGKILPVNLSTPINLVAPEPITTQIVPVVHNPVLNLSSPGSVMDPLGGDLPKDE